MPRKATPRDQRATSERIINSLAADLDRAGYVRATRRRHLRAARHALHWAEARGVELESLDEAQVARFGRHLRACRCAGFTFPGIERRCGELVTGVLLLLSSARTAGIVRSRPKEHDPVPDPPLVAAFSEWMRGARGAKESTVRIYRPILLDMLQALHYPATSFRPEALRAFVVERSRRHGRSKAKLVVTAMRMFLRYLATQGACPSALVCAVPTVAYWRLSSTPRYLPASDVDRVVNACDPSTAVGARDRAIILLLARLGFRASDIIALCLPDLDWRQSTVSVAGKSRLAVRLPLTQEVGDAVLHYLECGRPGIRDEHVFLRACAPWGALNWHGAISSLVARAIRRAGVSAASHGAHTLRHSAATEMLRGGASLQTIGAVLRHRSVETTAQYFYCAAFT